MLLLFCFTGALPVHYMSFYICSQLRHFKSGFCHTVYTPYSGILFFIVVITPNATYEDPLNSLSENLIFSYSWELLVNMRLFIP
jgi:hypothetical protein